MEDNKIGPNCKRLIAHKMSLDAIPHGGGFADGIALLSDRDKITESARSATEWVKTAISLVRTAKDPNPFKDADNETIAAEILRQIKDRKGGA